MNYSANKPCCTSNLMSHYVSLLFGWRSLQHRRDLDFVLFVASVGVSLAIKFFIPLLLPLTIVVWHHERRIEKAFQATLLLAGSFSAANFFNYTPWDLSRLLEMIRDENVSVVGGRTPLEQLGLYLWGTPGALGLAIWLFFAPGLAFAVARGWSDRPRGVSLDPAAWYSVTKAPYIVPVTALSLHFASLLAAGFHAPRHLLPFMPLMCFVAAIGFCRVSSHLGSSRTAAGGMMLALVVYQIYNAVGTEAWYTHDVRGALAAQISEVASPNHEVVSFHEYSQVRGVRRASERERAESRISSEFFVTCGYRTSDDQGSIFHAYREELRPDFYRDLFAERLNYHLIFEVSQKNCTLEQRLAGRRILPYMGTMSPSRCVLFSDTVQDIAIGERRSDKASARLLAFVPQASDR